MTKLSLSVACCLTLSLVAPASPALAAPRAAAPSVNKVEPPNWWPGHSINPVRLLIRGKGLQGATVSGAPGLTPGLVRVNAAGTAVFVDVEIDAQATPGPRQLTLRTAGGQLPVPFEVSSPLPRAGRFAGFSPDDVIYLIMPDRFADGDLSNDDPAKSKGLLDRTQPRHFHGGDLAGVEAKLPYLRELGVTTLWLNPWYDNTDRLNEKEAYDGVPSTGYHGYHAEDYYAVEERFGDLHSLRSLVDAAHAAGLKVIQDQVANHTGPYHSWLSDPPTPTWFNGTLEKHPDNTWQTWTLRDPYATQDTRAATLKGWFIDVLPDLNQDDEEVARYEIQNTLWWLGVSGVDGIRQDTLPYVSRRFWREWMAAIKAEYPQVKVVGELFDGDPTLVSFYQGGVTRFDGIDSGVDTLFDFPLYYPIRRAFAEGKPIREIPQMLSKDHLYVKPELLVTFLGLHDVQRFLNEPGATLEGLKLAFTFLTTARGIPLVYYGDEIAMPGGNDPDNRRDFPGGFPGDAKDAFTATGRTPEQESSFDHLKKLLALRQELEPLRRGRTLNLETGEQTYVFARRTDSQTVLVAFNNGQELAAVSVDATAAGLSEGQAVSDRLQAGGASGGVVSGGRLSLSLPPRSAAILTPSSAR